MIRSDNYLQRSTERGGGGGGTTRSFKSVACPAGFRFDTNNNNKRNIDNVHSPLVRGRTSIEQY